MKRLTVMFVAVVIAFVCVRSVRTAQLEQAAPPAAPVAHASTPSWQASRGPAPARDAAITVRPFQAEVRATAVESAEARDLRHEAQLAQIHARAPELPAAITDQLVHTADAVAEQTRKLRTSFLLGDVSEDEYLESRTAALRDGFHAARAVLTKEQFAKVFQWNSDADPFDPEGSTGRAQVTTSM